MISTRAVGTTPSRAKGGASLGRKKRGHGGRKGPTRSQRQAGLVGTVHMTERAGFVECAEGEFKLTNRGLREAMNGDRVHISLTRGPRGERRALVEDVIEHAFTSVIGTFSQNGPLGVVHPLDARIKQDFFILPTDESPKRFRVREGDIVSARIETYPSRFESGVATIVRRVGDADAPDLGIQCIMARYDLSDGYNPRALEEAESLDLDVDGALADPLRRDIRDRFLITIDPVDARDFDDAVSVERTHEGGWRLGVHIADVSHYVAWESSIDLEARARSTSVYLADRVLPMLPERLSNNLCSLVPREDRLAFTVDMELTPAGRVRSCEMYPSVIRSRVRMDYAAADVLLQDSNPLPQDSNFLPQESNPLPQDSLAPGVDEACLRARACCEEAAACGVDLAAFLRDANELAHARQKIRHERGAIDFETVEVHAILDDEGYPVELVNRTRSDATSLIEEAMLLANECVAERLADEGVTAAFRVHEPPSPDNLAAAARVLADLGAVSAQQASAIELGDPHAIEQGVEAAHGTPFEALVNALLLRAMQRAVYKPHNQGHFALGAPAYCHFTSPIRRYPDLLIHRALKVSLAREHLGKKGARERAATLVGAGRQALDQIASQLCRHASDRERLADAAAHATQKVKVAQYYGERIGERFCGTVSWLDRMGVFVRLDDTGAEGLIRMANLGGEWWELDEESLTLTGSSTGDVIELGRRMVIEVADVNVMRGHLDFKLVHAVTTARAATSAQGARP